ELGRLRLVAAVPALDRAVEDTDDAVRVAVVEALVAIGDDSIVPPLVASLKDTSDEVREPAAAWLAHRNTPAVVYRLGEALGSRLLRFGAFDVITRIGPSAAEYLIDPLPGSTGLRPAIGAALTRITTAEHYVQEHNV